MTPLARTTDTVIDQITAILDSLQYATKPLVDFKPADDEHCLNGAEVAGLCVHLHSARTMTEQCFELVIQMLRSDENAPDGYPPLDTEPFHENPLIQATLQGTLSEVINTLQFLIAVLERTDVEGDERIFNVVEAKGFLNMLNVIHAAADHCFEQCTVE